MRKYLIIYMILLPFMLNGQDLPLSNYHLNMIAFNPAFAGSRDAMSLNMFGRTQWTSFNGSPNDIFVSVHTPFSNDKVGFGGNIYKNFEGDGASSRTGFFLNYSYRIWLGGGRLAFGIKAGVENLVYDLSQISTSEPDFVFEDNYSKLLPNVGAGILYRSESYFVGFSIPEFLSIPDSTGTIGHDINNYNFILTVGYNFKLSDFINLQPTGYINYSLQSLYYIANLNVGLFDNFLWTGLSYRSDKRFALSFNVQVSNSLLVGYAMDFPLSPLVSISSWSHEIVIRYERRKIVAADNPFYY